MPRRRLTVTPLRAARTWRGGDLWTLGLVYVAMAVSLILSGSQWQQDLVHTHLPLPVRIGLWLIPGVLGIVCGWASSRRLQSLTFGLLCFAPALRMVSYAAAVLGYHGFDLSRLPGVVVYGAMLLLILRLAARPEPIEPNKLPAALQEALEARDDLAPGDDHQQADLDVKAARDDNGVH